MDARTAELIRPEQTTSEVPVQEQPVQKGHPVKKRVSKPRQVSQKRRKIRRRGREVVKVGMGASLTVSMLTGLRILRPMSMHPVASWIFVGLTVLHMLAYDSNGVSDNKTKSR